MSIHLTTEALLDFATLQNRIHEEESKVIVRLSSLTGKKEGNIAFNAHVYEAIEDNNWPFSKLFVIPEDGNSANDPNVMAWLAGHSGQEVVGDDDIYIIDKLTKIAIVGKKVVYIPFGS